MRARLWIAIGVASALAVVAAGCSSNKNAVANPPGVGGFAGGGGSGAAGAAGAAGAGFEAGLIDAGSGGSSQCDASNPCEAGVCVAGHCCASAKQACGDNCCSSTQVCLFDQCVTPGKPCQSKADCAANQYCETALGNNGSTDGGAADSGVGDSGVTDASAGDGGPVCTQPLPIAGRCVSLPPKCVGDAGAPDGGTCIENCEYKPPVGKLNAVVKWQWGQSPKPTQYPSFADVWATPTVARVYDANCDGKVDESDPPDIIFVSGDARGTCCSCGGYTPSTCRTGKLRMLDGSTGKEIWTLDKAKAGNVGFAGLSVALGDIDGDGKVDIVAMTGDGYLALIGADGTVKEISDQPVDTHAVSSFGWGGGIAIADMNGDGHPEIAYGRNLYSTTGGKITRLWVGTGGNGGGNAQELSLFADLDGDGAEELLAGNTAYKYDGSMLWNQKTLPNGFDAVADFNGDGKPDVVLVANNKVWILEGATGNIELGPVTLPGSGNGGPPTVADFDGDGKPEIGVANKDKYSMLKPDYVNNTINVVWSAPNHDLSSSVTGSSVFDFQGDGKAEVVYSDECFLWVYDGATGKVDLAEPTTSFTATEASVVADVDGDGHAEIVMISNGADPSPSGWGCDEAPWNQPDPANNRPAWKPPPGEKAYRGITIWGDKENSWVGTRTIWNEHTYHVSNICDSRDSACDAPNIYGSIPKHEKDNWQVPWLNDFRQNVQDKGVFDAPDATVSLAVECTSPVVLDVSVRNIGLAALPAGVEAGVFLEKGGTQTQLGTVKTTQALLPGQTQILHFTVPAGQATSNDTFSAHIIIDPNNKTFNECRSDNNDSGKVTATCGPA